MQPLPTSVITICTYPQIVLPEQQAGHAWSVGLLHLNAHYHGNRMGTRSIYIVRLDAVTCIIIGHCHLYAGL